jgi:hypothetical protein
MKLSKIIAALSLLMIIAFSASAQTTDKKRVRQGVRTGEITRTEMYKLGRQQRDIKKDRREARADGEVTSCERKEIRTDKKRQDATIYRLKHNNRDRN